MMQKNRVLALALCMAILAMPCPTAYAVESELDGGGGAVKYVALTFDDGPTGKLTGKLLDGLQERFISATFFLCGYRIEQFPETVRRMAKDGHELAIHGQTHIYLHNQPQDKIRQELEQTGNLIEELTGQKPCLFRPPGGLTSDALLAEARTEQLPIILWSVDPEDWNCHDAACVAERILSHVKDGDIILMHDLSDSSVKAAFLIIDQLQSKGYQFCTVTELAALRGVSLDPAKRYSQFPP